MANEIEKLRKEHVNFRKLLDLLNEQLKIISDDGLPDFLLMQDILYYMTQYSDIIHHPKEEVIFALLDGDNSDVEESVAELTRQHNLIEESGASLYRKLQNIVSGKISISQLQEIEGAGRLYETVLRAHMDKEEQSLFILAEQQLHEGDWEKINSATQTKPDPIFGEAIEARFHLVCEKLAQSADKWAMYESDGSLSGPI